MLLRDDREDDRPSFLDGFHCFPLVAVEFYQCLQIKLLCSVREIGEMGLRGFWQRLFSSPCQHHRGTFLDSLVNLVVFLEEKPAGGWEPHMAESLGIP